MTIYEASLLRAGDRIRLTVGKAIGGEVVACGTVCVEVRWDDGMTGSYAVICDRATEEFWSTVKNEPSGIPG